MKDCEFLERNLIDFIERKLNPESMTTLTEHIESCSDCRKLVNQFASVWTSTDHLEEIEPSPNFWVELQGRLNQIDEQGVRRSILARLRPVLQPVAASAALLIAVLFGYSFGKVPMETSESTEVIEFWSDYGLELFDQLPDGSPVDIYFELNGDEGDES